jgi:hypothetical protein
VEEDKYLNKRRHGRGLGGKGAGGEHVGCGSYVGGSRDRLPDHHTGNRLGTPASCGAFLRESLLRLAPARSTSWFSKREPDTQGSSRRSNLTFSAAWRKASRRRSSEALRIHESFRRNGRTGVVMAAGSFRYICLDRARLTNASRSARPSKASITLSIAVFLAPELVGTQVAVLK